MPFLTLPSSCPGTPQTTTGWMDGWRSIGTFAQRTFSSDLDGTPFVTTGCERLSFAPSMVLRTTSTAAGAPTGLNVDLSVPQSDSPDGLATANVRDVSVVLPRGMSVSPSSANGLGACLPGQIGLGTSADPTCPRSAKLGTVSVETPVLAEPLTGDILLAAPNDNPFDSLLSIYLVVQGSGVTLKLPGKIETDAATGQLTATFANNPQLPFSMLRVRFDGGQNAPLLDPKACGTYEAAVTITSWGRPTRCARAPARRRRGL